MGESWGESNNVGGRNLAVRNSYMEKGTLVLLRFFVALPIIRTYAKPLLLSTPRQESGNAEGGSFIE